MAVNGQHVEVSEDIFRAMLLFDNQERRQLRYHYCRHQRNPDGTWKTLPPWIVELEEYTSAYKLAVPEESNPEHQCEQAWLRQVLLEAINSLVEPCASIIKALFYQDMTQETAAALAGMSQPLLHYYKRKALAMLREYFSSRGLGYQDLHI